jgi:hypothetical protein
MAEGLLEHLAGDPREAYSAGQAAGFARRRSLYGRLRQEGDSAYLRRGVTRNLPSPPTLIL